MTNRTGPKSWIDSAALGFKLFIKLVKIMDLTTPESVAKLMASSKSERDWDDNADKVKAANNGYPSFWFEKIENSGLAAATNAKF